MSQAQPETDVPDAAGQPRPLGLFDAMAAARNAAALMTELPVDAVVSCERSGDGWRVIVDMLEAPARLGDNDLLNTYELTLDGAGAVAGVRRLRRYHREDGEAGA